MRAVIGDRLGISEADVLRNERYVRVDMTAVHAQLTLAILSAPTGKRKVRLEPRQRLARAFKCSPDALVAMALQPGLKIFSRRLQKAARRAGMRLEGWCEPTDIALCVVREHVVEQIAAAFAKTLDTASPDNEVMVFGRELMLGRHRRNMAEATA